VYLLTLLYSLFASWIRDHSNIHTVTCNHLLQHQGNFLLLSLHWLEGISDRLNVTPSWVFSRSAAITCSTSSDITNCRVHDRTAYCMFSLLALPSSLLEGGLLWISKHDIIFSSRGIACTQRIVNCSTLRMRELQNDLWTLHNYSCGVLSRFYVILRANSVEASTTFDWHRVSKVITFRFSVAVLYIETPF